MGIASNTAVFRGEVSFVPSRAEIIWTAVNGSGQIYAPSRHARVRASYDRSLGVGLGAQPGGIARRRGGTCAKCASTPRRHRYRSERSVGGAQQGNPSSPRLRPTGGGRGAPKPSTEPSSKRCPRTGPARSWSATRSRAAGSSPSLPPFVATGCTRRTSIPRQR